MSEDSDFETSNKMAPTNSMMYMEDLIPKFSGQDTAYSISQFTQDIDENAGIFEWTDLQQLIIARRSLTGTAALWLKAERPFKSWKTLKQALHKEFPDNLDSKTIHEIMSARKKKKDESCLDYLFTMRELGKRGKMPDYIAIKYIVDGIQDVETNKVMLYGVTSYSELKEKLKIYEAITEKMRSYQSMRLGEAINHRSRHVENQVKKKCYSCGENDHVSNMCPHKQQGAKCFKCNKFGHISSQCSTSRSVPKVENNNFPKQMCVHVNELNELNQHEVSQSSSSKCNHANEIDQWNHYEIDETETDQSTPLYECNFVTDRDVNNKMADIDDSDTRNVNQNVNSEAVSMGKPMKMITLFGQNKACFIDSGSDLNLISEDCHLSLCAPEFVRSEISLTGFGAARVKGLGYVSTNIVIDGECFEDIVLHVVPKDVIPFAIILGHEFLRNITLIMDGSRVLLLKPDQSWLRYFMCGMGVSNDGVGFVADPKLKQEEERLVETYHPDRTREARLEIRTVMKNDIPVAERPRCVAVVDKAIKRTQYGVCVKLKPKVIGQYRVVAVKGNDYYDIEKLTEGPNCTSTSADYMKPWPAIVCTRCTVDAAIEMELHCDGYL